MPPEVTLGNLCLDSSTTGVPSSDGFVTGSSAQAQGRHETEVRVHEAEKEGVKGLPFWGHTSGFLPRRAGQKQENLQGRAIALAPLQ